MSETSQPAAARRGGAGQQPRPVRVGFVSLGCPKNLVDSEVMMGLLRREGLVITPDAAEAEVIVVNTCGFIDTARQESIDTILEMAELKRSGACRRLVVAGCLVQRQPEEMRRALPEVDAFLGLDDLGKVAAAVRGERGDAEIPAGGPATYLYDHQTPRILAGPSHSVYLKIAEGCDNPCAFCAIPKFRGAFRSRRMGSILAEAQALVAGGAVELNLIAQDSTNYGLDLGLEDGVARLLEGLAEVDGARWIRLFYLYPNRITDRLIEVMAGHDNICEYVDIPLQHASRTVLQRMVRGGSADHHRRILRRFREAMPAITLRTTMIVGFPGETEAEFAELIDFVEEARFDRLGAFTYSHEESTRAAALADDVPPEVKEERRERLMAVQEEISISRNRDLVGRILTVLCDGISSESEHLLEGRTEGQAPEVDGVVYLVEGEAHPGDLVPVEITEAHPYDLVGRVVGAPALA